MVLLWATVPVSAQVPSWVHSTNAVEFFTNLSTRLLRAQDYPFDAGNIPVYTNGAFAFSPDVHRVLQVAANLYDASTNRADRGGPDFPFLPSVFRPVFKSTNGNVFIGGWVEEAGGTAWTSTPRLLTSPAIAATVQPDDNLFDVPWIIGAKKGFPNLNEFSLQSVVSITRKLQLVKATPLQRPFRTNQMFMVGISNLFGFEAWNSYPSNYTRDVQIVVIHEMATALAFTNDVALDGRGGQLTSSSYLGTWSNIPANTWAGAGNSADNPAAASFVVPLWTNTVFLPNSVYRAEQQSGPFFTTSTNVGMGLRAGFEDTGRFLIPDFHLAITNRIRFYMLDAATGRLIDYVCLGELNAHRNLSAELHLDDAFPYSDGFDGSSLWATNRVGGNISSAPPHGVISQIEVSLGQTILQNWNTYGINQPTGNNQHKEIDFFRAFCGLTPLYYGGTINTNLVTAAPFTPTRRTSQRLIWQANDPLVHSLTAHLASPALGSGLAVELPAGPINTSNNLGRLNYHFEPWSDTRGYLQTRQNVLLKDPLIRRAADWPEGGFGPLSLNWLGRVHRGTPWQTLYLKSGAVNPTLWTNWLGDWPKSAAAKATPDSDWIIAAEIARILNTHHPLTLLPANSPDTNAWLATLNGLSALTNASPDASLFTGAAPTMSVVPVSDESPQSLAIVAAIRQGQAQTGTLQHPGELLSIPELSLASPWLNRSSAIQLQRGITDEAYEKLPTQLLPRLRNDLELTLVSAPTPSILRVSSYDGFPCVVEASSDLRHWQALGTNQPSDGVFWFTDDSAGGVDARFYRAFVLP